MAVERTLPQLSVVVASFNSDGILRQCLGALAVQVNPEDVEVLVVRDVERSAGIEGIATRTRFPRLVWIDADSGTTVPRLRMLGILRARADRVALLEDDCIVQSGWVAAATSALIRPGVAVAGAVEPGPYHRALDWGVFFCEYARFMLPLSTAAYPPIPGNNAVYDRRALTDPTIATDDGFQEAFAQSVWQRIGLLTTATEAMVVENVNTWTLQNVTTVPYHHGRAFAARRFADRSVGFRSTFALLALCLAALKTIRIAIAVVSRKRLAGRLLQAMPSIVLFNVSWSIGEGVGCLFGTGTSPLQWK